MSSRLLVFCGFLVFSRALGVGGLDAQEHGVEPGLDHGIHQLAHAGEIDARLRVQSERIPPGLLPLGDHRQQLHRLALVADEVVVDQEDRAPPPQPVQGVELLDDLVRRLGPGHLAVELDDVAELAVERTSARELHAHRPVALHVDEVEARHRGPGHVGLPGLPVHDLRGAVGQVAQELGKDLLGLVQHEVGHAFDLVMERGGMRPPGHHRDPGPVAPRDDVLERGSLHDHGGREHHVGPFQVRVLQRRHVHVHDAERVLGREHRGDGEQPQGRKGRLHPQDVEREVRPPVGRGLSRIDQQGVLHGRSVRVRLRQSAARTASEPRPSRGGK